MFPIWLLVFLVARSRWPTARAGRCACRPARAGAFILEGGGGGGGSGAGWANSRTGGPRVSTQIGGNGAMFLPSRPSLAGTLLRPARPLAGFRAPLSSPPGALVYRGASGARQQIELRTLALSKGANFVCRPAGRPPVALGARATLERRIGRRRGQKKTTCHASSAGKSLQAQVGRHKLSSLIGRRGHFHIGRPSPSAARSTGRPFVALYRARGSPAADKARAALHLVALLCCDKIRPTCAGPGGAGPGAQDRARRQANQIDLISSADCREAGPKARARHSRPTSWPALAGVGSFAALDCEAGRRCRRNERNPDGARFVLT